jgi:hypothetical protein
MIKNLSFHLLRRDEYYTFGIKVLDVLSGFNLETVQLIPLHGRVKKGVDKLDHALVKSSTTTYTLNLAEADVKRDCAFLALRYNLLACSKRLQPEWNSAANLLIATIRSYGWNLHKENYSTESSKLKNFLADLEEKPELKSAVAFLNLDNWINELKQSQIDFESIDKARLELKASRSEVKTADACLEIRKSCELLFQYINMMQELNPQDEFIVITRLLNEVIDEFTFTINQRKGKISKDDEESDEDNSSEDNSSDENDSKNE